MLLFIEEKSVGRFEWSCCPLFVCFKVCWNHILQLCSLSTYYFVKIALQALHVRNMFISCKLMVILCWNFVCT